MKRLMQINRHGVIIVSPSQGTEHQCVVQNHTTYYYECRVKLTEPTLDERGFIADHQDIHQAITDMAKGSTVPSCELLAQAMAETVSKWLITQGQRHDEVYIKITSTPVGSQAFIEAWVMPEEEDYPKKTAPMYRARTKEELLALGGRVQDNDMSRWTMTTGEGNHISFADSTFAGKVLTGKLDFDQKGGSRKRYIPYTIDGGWYQLADDFVVEMTEEEKDIYWRINNDVPTENPPHTVKYRIRSMESLRNDPEIHAYGDGFSNSRYTGWWNNRMEEVAGTMLTGEQEDSYKRKQQFRILGASGATWTISPWMVEEIR